MTMTAEQARNYILELVDWEETNGYKTTDLVMECFNCRQVTIDPIGDIFISAPQSGHWLSDEELAKFVVWHKERMDA